MTHVNEPFTSLVNMMAVLSTDQLCREFFEQLRWEGKPACPHCGTQSERHYKLKTKGVFNGMYKCSEKLCHGRFTVTMGTIFEGSHIPLRKWFMAIYVFSSHKKGISSHQLAKDLGITQKSAWFMLSLLRNSFKPKTFSVLLSDTVQCDESFIGGKEENKHKNKKTKGTQGRSTKTKTPVFGLLSNGTVNTHVVTDTKAKTLKPIIKEMVEAGAVVVTDEWKGYRGLAKTHSHKVVSHKKKEFVKDGYHVNSIEGFWSLLKRGIFGIYHRVSPKHLNKYCDEFAYRYNTRNMLDADRFVVVLASAKTRMTYKEIIIG